MGLDRKRRTHRFRSKERICKIVLCMCAVMAQLACQNDIHDDDAVLMAHEENSTNLGVHTIVESPDLEAIGYTQPSLLTEKPIECLADVDCVHIGPWQRCKSGACTLDPVGRTLRVVGARLQEPVEWRSVLNRALNRAIARKDLNMIVHLGASNHWLIQGDRTGRLGDTPTYGQVDRFESIFGQSQIACTQKSCTTVFRPHNEDQSMAIYLETSAPMTAECRYQKLRMVDVKIQLILETVKDDDGTSSKIDARIMVMGILPQTVADDFMLDDETNLFMMMDEISSVHQVPIESKGWPIVLAGTAHEVYFDNDPGSDIVLHPSAEHPSVTGTKSICQ